MNRQHPQVPTNTRFSCARMGKSFTAKLLFLAIPALSTMLAGCGRIEPWVKPYERDRLADPIMIADRNPISTSYLHHVFEAREGARGALGGVGGGCGCN